MKYKIEIWQHQKITETYANEDISEVLNWYKSNWLWIYEMDDCWFDIYKGDTKLTFEEKYKFGFYG